MEGRWYPKKIAQFLYDAQEAKRREFLAGPRDTTIDVPIYSDSEFYEARYQEAFTNFLPARPTDVVRQRPRTNNPGQGARARARADRAAADDDAPPLNPARLAQMRRQAGYANMQNTSRSDDESLSFR